MTVSAIVLTRNEEKNIRFCLESLAWCTEIIVVDMQSTDRTKEIAAEFNTIIIDHDIIEAFDVAREKGATIAKGEWIIFLDADEIIPVSVVNTLKEIISKAQADVIYLPRINLIMGKWIKHSGWWPDYQPRLYKKGCVTFTSTLHDFMHIDKNAKTYFLPAIENNAFYHFNYLNLSHFIEKMNRYTSVEASHIERNSLKLPYVKLLKKPLSEFYSRYIKHKGFLDGWHGFILSVMMAMYRFIIVVKYLEKQWQFQKNFKSYDEIRNKLIQEIKDSHNLL